MRITLLLTCIVALAAPKLISAQFLPAGETFVVTKTTDSNDGACDADCSLREAVIAANGNDNAGYLDEILLGPGTYELTLVGRDEEYAATGDLDILQEVWIRGDRHRPTIIDANQIDRVFHVWVVEGDPNALGDGVQLTNLTITGGKAVAGSFPGTGGGIRSAGDLGVFWSTISGNHADQLGGGIDSVNGHLEVFNSTVSGNTTDGSGGGISMYPIGLDPPDLDLAFTTIADNSALVSGSAIATLPSGLSSPEVETIFNSIIVGDCDLAQPIPFVNNAQWSIESPGNTCSLLNSNDLVSVSASDLKLGALADYGGPSKTHSPFAGSVAIDLIPSGGLCPSSTAQRITDQRWLHRLFDGDGDGEYRCDAGAVEVQPLSIFADGFESGDTLRWSASLP